MNRTVFSLPAFSRYRTQGGLWVVRTAEVFSGQADRLDTLIEQLDRRRGVVLSSGTTVPGRYDSFDLGFSDPPLVVETRDENFSVAALNARGEVLIAFLADTLARRVRWSSSTGAAPRTTWPRRRCTGGRRPAYPPRQRD